MYVGASVSLVRLRLRSGSTGRDESVSQPSFRPFGARSSPTFTQGLRSRLQSRAAMRLWDRLVPTFYREVRLRHRLGTPAPTFFLVLGQPLLRDESSCFG